MLLSTETNGIKHYGGIIFTLLLLENANFYRVNILHSDTYTHKMVWSYVNLLYKIIAAKSNYFKNITILFLK